MQCDARPGIRPPAPTGRSRHPPSRWPARQHATRHLIRIPEQRAHEERSATCHAAPGSARSARHTRRSSYRRAQREPRSLRREQRCRVSGVGYRFAPPRRTGAAGQCTSPPSPTSPTHFDPLSAWTSDARIGDPTSASLGGRPHIVSEHDAQREVHVATRDCAVPCCTRTEPVPHASETPDGSVLVSTRRHEFSPASTSAPLTA